MSKPGQLSTHCRDWAVFLPASSGTRRRACDGALEKRHSGQHGTHLDPPDGYCARPRRPSLGQRTRASNTGSTRICNSRTVVDTLLEFAAGNGLVETHAARGDVGFEIIFAEDGRTGQAAQHGDLADVIERVRDGALKETFSRTMERLRRSEVIVELWQRCEKAIDLRIPRQRREVVPSLFALRDRERPVKKIAHMRENLRRRARLVADMEGAKVIRRAAQRFSAAVSNGRKRVAQKLASRIGRRGDGRASHR